MRTSMTRMMPWKSRMPVGVSLAANLALHLHSKISYWSLERLSDKASDRLGVLACAWELDSGLEKGLWHAAAWPCRFPYCIAYP